MGQCNSEIERVKALTQKQRDCLHLVVLRKSSKEIARALNISKHAVDQRVTTARLRLGAGSRDEAALIFARHSGTYDRVLYDPLGIPTNAFLEPEQGSEEQFEEQYVLSDSSETVSFVDAHFASKLALYPFSSRDLSAPVRLGLITCMILMILVATLISLSVAQSLAKLLH